MLVLCDQSGVCGIGGCLHGLPHEQDDSCNYSACTYCAPKARACVESTKGLPNNLIVRWPFNPIEPLPPEDDGLIQDHDDYPDVVQAIENYGNHTKTQLVAMLWDESGAGMTKQQLREHSRGQLLAMHIDGLFGGACQ